MQYKATLYMADKKINKWMQAFDMRENHKWFVVPHSATFSTPTKVNEKYFHKIINKSKKADMEFWIPAIEFGGVLYVHESVAELSDGKRGMFVGILD